MNRLGLIVLPLLLSNPVLSEELDYDPCFPIPPAEYTTITKWPDNVFYASKEEVSEICEVPQSWTAYGCYILWASGTVDIYIAATDDPVANMCILQHELAHVQGWRHN